MNIDLGLSGPQKITEFNLKQHYISLLTPYKEQLLAKELTSQPFMKGELSGYREISGEKFKILFVGRAVNGWEIDFQDGEVNSLVEQVFRTKSNIAHVSQGKTDGYNYNRSPFFQLAHQVMNQFGQEEDWAKKFGWTNLYKVAPYKTGNPTNKIIGETVDKCATILRAEISHFKPTHIVFITSSTKDDVFYKPEGKDINTKAFVDALGVDLFDEPQGVICGSGVCSTVSNPHAKVVITQRPECAGISRADHAKAIFDEFAKIVVE